MPDVDIRLAFRSFMRSDGYGLTFDEMKEMEKHLQQMRAARQFYIEVRDWRPERGFRALWQRHLDSCLNYSVEDLVEKCQQHFQDFRPAIKMQKAIIVSVHHYELPEKNRNLAPDTLLRPESHGRLKEMTLADAAYVPKAYDQVFVRIRPFFPRVATS